MIMHFKICLILMYSGGTLQCLCYITNCASVSNITNINYVFGPITTFQIFIRRLFSCILKFLNLSEFQTIFSDRILHSRTAISLYVFPFLEYYLLPICYKSSFKNIFKFINYRIKVNIPEVI